MMEHHPNLLTAVRRTVLSMQVKDEITPDEQHLINSGFMPASIKKAIEEVD